MLRIKPYLDSRYWAVWKNDELIALIRCENKVAEKVMKLITGRTNDCPDKQDK